jgi:hypothetical protein
MAYNYMSVFFAACILAPSATLWDLTSLYCHTLGMRFYSACIVRCIGLCRYYQGEHNNSEKPEKREHTKD